MTAFVGNGFPQVLLPENLAVSAVQGDSPKPVPLGHGDAIMGALRAAVARRELLPEGFRRRQENAVSPYDGC